LWLDQSTGLTALLHPIRSIDKTKTQPKEVNPVEPEAPVAVAVGRLSVVVDEQQIAGTGFQD
jgi:hypothetical protein